MFRFFKPWSEKCFSCAYRLSGVDEKTVRKWLLAFEPQINEMHAEGERKPDFCIAWCATCHLHKLADADNPQDQFLGSRCAVSINDDALNEVSIKICEATVVNMHAEMKEGVLSSLQKINSKQL